MKQKNFILDQNRNFYTSPKFVFKKKVPILGEFAGFFKFKKNIVIYRDHLGCRKFFYYFDKTQIICSENFIKLSKKVKNLNKIYSAKPGYYLEYSSKGKILSQSKIPKANFQLDKKKMLYLYLKKIKENYGDKCCICLSGGLDSTIIAHYAKKIFSDCLAITIVFDYKYGSNSFPDYNQSKLIAKNLKIKHMIIKEKRKNIQKHLKKILYSSQDWRDYNVHCAVLNYFIAKNLKKNRKLKKRLILTGDFMNEFFADYSVEKFKGQEFYVTPDLPKKTMQRFYTQALESSSREVGVFNFFNLQIFQPYNCLKDFYFKLSNKTLSKKNIKYKINADFINKSTYKLVNKNKIRAQIGDITSGGILGYFIDKNLFQDKIKKLFKLFFNLGNSWQDNFISLGKYKVQI